MPCALPDHIMRMGQWATCRTDHAAHAKAHVRAGIADHPDGPWTVQGMVPRTTLTDHGPFGGPTKYVVHAKAHAGTPRGPPLVHGPGRTMASPSTGPRSKDHMGRSAGGPGSCGPWPESPSPSGRSPQTHMEQSHAHRAARPEPVPHPRQSTNRLPTVDVSPFGRSRHPPGPPCPASLRQPAPNKQRHNRHIREIKPDMKTSTQTDEKHDTETRNNEDRTKNPHSQPQGTTPSENPRKSTSRCNLRRRWTSCTHRLTAAAYRRNCNVFDGVCRPGVRYRGSALSTGRETRAGWGRP